MFEKYSLNFLLDSNPWNEGQLIETQGSLPVGSLEII